MRNVAVMIRIGVPVVAVAALAYAGVATARMQPRQLVAEPPGPPPQSPFAHAVAGLGLVEPSSESVAVAAPVDGIVASVAVAAGERVRAGQALFSLDGRSQRADRTVAEGTASVARAELRRLRAGPRPDSLPPLAARAAAARAERDDVQAALRRLEPLHSEGIVSDHDLTRARNAVRSAEAVYQAASADLAAVEAGAWDRDVEVAAEELERARAAVARSSTDLDRLTVRAPLDGMILAVNVRAGESAPPAAVVLGRVDPLHVRVTVDEADHAQLRVGARAVGFARGAAAARIPLAFVRREPRMRPKQTLDGSPTERVDTRVAEIVYRVAEGTDLMVGQQLDVYVEAP